MATEVRTTSAELYDADFYDWALEQAELVRAKRFDALDLDNLIEEIGGLADTKLSAVRGHGASSEAPAQPGERPAQQVAGEGT